MTLSSFKQSSVNNNIRYESMRVGYPATPVIGTATDGGTGTTVSVAFTGVSGATSYTALSTPGSLTATGAASPITVSGLTSGTAYTFQVRATNSIGTGVYSAASNSVTPVVPTSYESIATVTASAGATSLSFSSIPGTYTHLQIRGISRIVDAAFFSTCVIQFNGITTSTYSVHRLENRGITPAAFGYANQPSMEMALTAATNFSTDNFGASITDIHDYKDTTKFKTMRSISGASDFVTSNNNGIIALNSGNFRSTNAITSIQISANGSAFAAGTTFALYGVK